MRKIVFILLALFAGLTGCKEPPLEEIASARAAIEAARDAEAPKYAAETFAAAEGKLEEAYADVDEKEYALARSHAISARELAEAALREARKRKEEDASFARKEEQARAAKGAFEPEVEETVAQPSLTGVGVASTELPPVLFDFDAYTIREDQRATLDKAVDWLMEHPEIRLRLEGHTDERGEAEYNLALGRRRALAVKDDIMAAGILSSRVETVSLGEEDPANLGHDEQAWSENRRVTFMLMRPNESLPSN